MKITKDTPYRDIGPVAYADWKSRITGAGGRKALASREAWEAAGPMSAVLLRILNQESSFDTDYQWNSKANNNPYNIRVRDRSNETNPKGYIKYPNLVAATNAAAERITGAPGYFDGPNPYADAVTIEELLNTYAPPQWNDTEGLIARMVKDLNAWLPNWSPPVTPPTTPEEPIPGEGEPPMAITFGKVPKPRMQNRLVENSLAWDDLGKRTIRGVVWHRMYGSLWGTDGYFRGEAVRKALTDYGVGVTETDGAGNDGVILMWNDPTSRRSPWASGPVSNPIGDGAKFVDRYGKNAVNRDLVSIEISGDGGTPLSVKARKAVVALTAWYADRAHIPWDEFPNVPGEDRSFVLWHGEIYDGKRGSCPGGVVEQATGAMLKEVAAILKKHQTSAAPAPKPQPEPEPDPEPQPQPDIVPGVDWGIAARAFGTNLSGYVLTKGGPLSMLYVERAKQSGEWPQLVERWTYGDGRAYFWFSNGWMALFTEGDKSIRWIEPEAA